MASIGGSGNLTLPAMLIALITTGVVVGTSYDPQGSRPEASGSYADVRHEQDKVEAQLWEAPLLAVQRKRDCPAIEESRPEARQRVECEPAVGSVWKNLANSSPVAAKVIILPVIINDDPSTMREERERRDRYAVVTALIDRGLIPADSAHLKYYSHDLSSKSGPNTRADSTWRVQIPYEWYQSGSNQVLVLWLAKSWLSQSPSWFLFQILSTLTSAYCDPQLNFPDASGRCETSHMGMASTTIGILGLGGTGSIKKVMRQLELDNGGVIPQKEENPKKRTSERKEYFTTFNVTLYDYSTTAQAGFLLSKTEVNRQGNPALKRKLRHALDKKLIDNFRDKLGIHYRRTIAQDYELLEGAIGRELAIRKVDYCYGPLEQREHQMLFVVEADTDYGRSFQEIIKQDAENCTINRKIVSYLRGVDGIAPYHHKDKDSEKRGGTDEIPSAFVSGNQYGASRSDYFQRLARITASEDSHVDLEVARTVAIGILGSDIYDKLLILEMMKRQYPNALYFTTDLDSLFFERENSKWSRNLIVASAYGLTPRAQDFSALNLSEVAENKHNRSFRSSYQTSLYLATILALEDWKYENEDDKWQGFDSTPQYVFEISRSDAIELNCLHQVNCESHYKISSWLKINYIRFIASSNLFLFVLCYFILVNIRPIIWKVKAGKDTDGQGITAIISRTRLLSYSDKYQLPKKIELATILTFNLTLTTLFLVLFVHLPALETTLEPFTLIEGVGTWIPLLLRGIAFLLTLVLLLRVNVILRENALEIDCRYCKDAKWPEFCRHGNAWCLRNTQGQLMQRRKNECKEMRKDMRLIDYWAEHVADVENLLTLKKHAIAGIVILVTLVMVGEFLFTVTEDFHYRGAIVYADKLIGYLALTLLALMIYMAYRVNVKLRLLMDRLCGVMKHAGTHGARATDNKNGPEESRENFILPLLICAERSRISTPLLIQPFIILLLLLITFHDIFKIDAREPYVYIYALLASALLFFGGVNIRSMATRMRVQVINCLEDNMSRLLQNPQKLKSELEFQAQTYQYELQRKEVSALELGAFAPLQKDPIVAILLLVPVGWISSVLLILIRS